MAFSSSHMLGRICKPEYVFNPTQIVRRIFLSLRKSKGQYEETTLPWAISLRVRPNETIGRAILNLGVYDLGVTETLWRLIDPGETVVDVGANIGYVTSLMASRVGRLGRVYAFEPHPEIYGELLSNKREWEEAYGWQHIEVRQLAVSSVSGISLLTLPPVFQSNRGTAYISEKQADEATEELTSGRGVAVSADKLDNQIEKNERISLIKLDVEGHELDVLKGATSILASGVRDIVFEEHHPYPSPVINLLEDFGYTIFIIRKKFWGVCLERMGGVRVETQKTWEPPNYLATRDSQRVRERMRKKGWTSLYDSWNAGSASAS